MSGARLPKRTIAYSVSKAALNALTFVLADALAPGALVDAACGRVGRMVATDMGRPSAEGAAGTVWAVTLPDGGPRGGSVRDARPLPW